MTQLAGVTVAMRSVQAAFERLSDAIIEAWQRQAILSRAARAAYEADPAYWDALDHLERAVAESRHTLAHAVWVGRLQARSQHRRALQGLADRYGLDVDLR